jgi:hypothetical protein
MPGPSESQRLPTGFDMFKKPIPLCSNDPDDAKLVF